MCFLFVLLPIIKHTSDFTPFHAITQPLYSATHHSTLLHNQSLNTFAAKIVRYAKDIQLNIKLVATSKNADGRIYTPYLSVEYDFQDDNDVDTNTTVAVSDSSSSDTAVFRPDSAVFRSDSVS